MESKDATPMPEEELKSAFQQSPYINSLPMIAAILLIIAGIIAIISWVPLVMGDEALITYTIQNLSMDLTREQVKDLFVFCGSIEIVLAIFPILGCFLALKRKFWGITLLCSVLGIFTIGSFFSSTALSFIALVLIIISKPQFQEFRSS